MEFIIAKNQIDDYKNQCSITFYYEDDAFPGVRKIADKVRKDVERVVSAYPRKINKKEELGEYAVIYGTVGHSPILEYLNENKIIDLSQINDKREVYIFKITEIPMLGIKSALIIAGSDKRGTIYGLFHLSECMGVSPLVDWSEVNPKKVKEVILTPKDSIISRIPSVKYRGIFINDEWPAFGTWAIQKFGGFNAKMYEHVFELILRCKGNYLWPAMWHSNFSMDGPGLLNAELADEYGIVIGSSHHEPCMRNGEEYSLLRGKYSIYGDDWSFINNREGILKFWEDGLKRNGKFENIITLGMRGERDTAILEKNSTLEENIALLRDVIKEQNRLIRENVNEALENIPRLLVLFTEVERFFYGDKNTTGLINDKELEGVTLMLTDDNFGNLRTVPDEEMRKHNGGYGLYYHLDFHGGAYSYEWTNTSYLPKMWEQLSMAYDYGIREVWIANVGDISLQEYPLEYFLDLAYDFDKWGSKAPNTIDKYTELWIEHHFKDNFSVEDKTMIKNILNSYTHLNHNRKPEIINSKVYHPVHFGEADNILKETSEIMEQAEILRNKCLPEVLPAYYELVYYPAVASANVQRMQVFAAKNEFYAKQGRVEANDYADKIAACIRKDRELTEEFHSIADEKWYGMGLSEHIGFVSWCEEGCKYPLMIKIEPANKPRIIVAQSHSAEFTEGGEWTGKKLYVNDFLRPDVNEVSIDIACGSRQPVEYEIATSCRWLKLSRKRGCVSKKDIVTIGIDRRLLKSRETAEVIIKAQGSKVTIVVEAENYDISNLHQMTFLETQGYIAMEAEHYYKKYDLADVDFIKLDNYGRTKSAMKLMPNINNLSTKSDKPWLEYCFAAKNEGEYFVELYLAPSNTTYIDGKMNFGMQINGEEIKIKNAVCDNFTSLDFRCSEWVKAIIDNIRIYKDKIYCKKGINYLRIYGISSSFVLEKIVLYSINGNVPKSYLGPVESFYCK